MPIYKRALLSALAVCALGTIAVFADDLPVVDPAIATMTVDQKVEARQAAMKDDGRLLRGAMRSTGDDAVAAATTLLQNFTNFPALFADHATNDKSEALPVVWEQFDKFTALFDEGRTAAANMLAAAKAGDNAQYMAAIKTMSGLCSDCHQTYRMD